MISGVITDIVLCIYYMTDCIEFITIKGEDGYNYLHINMTNDDEYIGDAIYFRWNNIPASIYTIYLHAKLNFTTTYNKESKEYILTGTHINRRNVHKYILNRFDEDNYPINKTIMTFDEYNTKEFYEIAEKNYKSIVNKMITIKKFPKSTIRGSIIVSGG